MGGGSASVVFGHVATPSHNETVFCAGRLQSLHEFFLSPGIVDERMHLLLACTGH
jgi:hypothetical protein